MMRTKTMTSTMTMSRTERRRVARRLCKGPDAHKCSSSVFVPVCDVIIEKLPSGLYNITLIGRVCFSDLD